MKSRTNFLCGILLLLFFMMAEFAFSQSIIPVSLAGDTTGVPGAAVNIQIKVGDLTDKGVIAYQAVITFDQSVLDATGASSTGTLSEPLGVPTANISVKGKITVGGFGTSPLSGSGNLVTLKFKVVGQPGTTTNLVFSNFVFNAGVPSTITQNGKFTVSFRTGIHDAAPLPEAFTLRQNYPNPFNPETTISFDVPVALTAPVTLRIFNIHGQLVKTLVDGMMPPGTHTVVWSGKDAADEPVSSGFYFYHMTSGNFVAVRKMLLAK